MSSFIQSIYRNNKTSIQHSTKQTISKPLENDTTTPVAASNNTSQHQHTKMSSFKLGKKFHIPLFNNTSKTAPAKAAAKDTCETSSNDTTLNSIPSIRKQTIVHRTDIGNRRNTIWSDTVEEDLVDNLSPIELKRQEVLFEIIKTEQEYVRDLKLMEELFINPIKEAEQKSRKQIVPENLNKIFNSVSYFLFIHEVISNCLNERQENQSPLVRSISDILLAYVWVFRAYAPYLIHYEKALRELSDAVRKKNKLGQLVRKQQKFATCRNMPLSTYLLKPFQRLLKYPLLITNLLKCTDKDGCDYENTVSLKTKLDNVLQDVEGQKQSQDNIDRLRELETRIQGLGHFRLAVNHRQLVGENPACQNINKPPSSSIRKTSLTVASAPELQSKRHSIRNLYTLECNDIVLLAERTGLTKEGQPIYKLVSNPPKNQEEPAVYVHHKSQDSGYFSEE
nr:13647_t:CDS:2 [Entrophospora candida]CAG8500937.1 2273_t:CDS:2 [Entrophospora candida]